MLTTNVTPSNANIFKELKLPDAEYLLVKAELMAQVSSLWRKSGLTQKEMAVQMGVTPASLNDVVKGRIDKCTIDRLVSMLAAYGKHIKVIVHDAV